MRRYHLPLILSIVMFTITTFLMIMVPQAVAHPLDLAQKGLLICLGVMGYTYVGLAISLFLDAKQKVGSK